MNARALSTDLLLGIVPLVLLVALWQSRVTFGYAPPTLLPDGFLVGGGKDGNFYLVDPAKMTNTSGDAVLATPKASSRP